MPRNWSCNVALAVGMVAVLASSTLADEPSASFKQGNPQWMSVGPLGFGPDGILFVGDPRGAALIAIDTGDRAPATEKRPLEVNDLTSKLAAMMGTRPQQIMIHDLAVHPLSGNVYLSVSRGRGPEAIPALVRLTADGAVEELPLDNLRFARVELPNPPDPNTVERGQALRNESITDIAYADGRVFVAGLSNEEFSSRLIAIPFPFSEDFDGAAIEIYHGAHGRFETRSPIRTFVPYPIADQLHLLAAYTCTPLVKVPVSELKAGAHVRGTTIAELGNRNRPLDMITYTKDGKDFLLLANSNRGVMRIPVEGAAEASGITEPVEGTRGLQYETIEELKGVVQLDKLDEHRAVILVQDDTGAMNVKTIELP
jgi:hypothetical protein